MMQVSTDMGRLAESVAAGLGMRFSEPGQGRFTSAVRRVMAAHRVRADRLLQQLTWDEDLVRDLVSAVAVGETYFFRGAEQFAFIRDEIIPEIRERCAGRRIRICSIGCSTGEEPYSLAILCAAAGLTDEVEITGFDIRRRALARARDGEYDSWSLRRLTPDFRQRCFTPSGRRFRLRHTIAAQVRFRLLDVSAQDVAWPDVQGGYDLVLCRNVLVYYDQTSVSRIGRHLFECLSEGGWLITAPVDPLVSRVASFATMTTDTGVVYRRPVAAGPAASPRMGAAPDIRPKGTQPWRPDDCRLLHREGST